MINMLGLWTMHLDAPEADLRLRSGDKHAILEVITGGTMREQKSKTRRKESLSRVR